MSTRKSAWLLQCVPSGIASLGVGHVERLLIRINGHLIVSFDRRRVIGEEKLSSTSAFNRCHSPNFSTTFKSFMRSSQATSDFSQSSTLVSISKGKRRADGRAGHFYGMPTNMAK